MQDSEHQVNESASAPVSVEEPSPSSIQELQSAFESILQAQKGTPKPPMRSTLQPWPGPFSLFKVPRELRDNIYFFVVYRPKGLLWSRQHTWGTNPTGGRWTHDFVRYWHVDQQILSLFLTTRQVYEEALYVFCSCNAIFIEKRVNSFLERALRIFPSKAANMLQRIELRYLDINCNPHAPGNAPPPGHTFEKMIRDAQLAKEHFPRLRECTFLWYTKPAYFLEADKITFDGQTEEVKVENWLAWMRLHCKRCNMLPPTWLYIRFVRQANWQRFNSMKNHQASLDEALELFRRESRGWELQNTEFNLENSGKKWLEKEWGDGKRRGRKGKIDSSLNK